MNSATFRTFIAACGLESTSFAALAGYAPRTVRRWCLSIDPPEHAVAAVEELACRLVEMQQVALDSADDAVEPEVVTLVRYRNAEEYERHQPDSGITFDVHCALVNFVAMSLVAEGYGVEVNFPPAEYEDVA